jgi:hypothetical protein
MICFVTNVCNFLKKNWEIFGKVMHGFPVQNVFFPVQIVGFFSQKKSTFVTSKIWRKTLLTIARFLEHESSWPRTNVLLQEGDTRGSYPCTNVLLQEGDTRGSYLGCKRRCWTVIKNRKRPQLLSGRFLRFIILILKKSKKSLLIDI